MRHASALRLPLFAAALGLAACGEEEVSASVGARVTMDALLADEVSALHVYALGARRSDGIFVTCTALLNGVMQPDADTMPLLGTAEISFSGGASSSGRIEGLPAESGITVYVSATGANQTVIGAGCMGNVTVESEKTTQVSVTVFAL